MSPVLWSFCRNQFSWVSDSCLIESGAHDKKQGCAFVLPLPKHKVQSRSEDQGTQDLQIVLLKRQLIFVIWSLNWSNWFQCCCILIATSQTMNTVNHKPTLSPTMGPVVTFVKYLAPPLHTAPQVSPKENLLTNSNLLYKSRPQVTH